MRMHPTESFIHEAKHSRVVEAAKDERKVITHESVDPRIEKLAKKARATLLKAIDAKPRLVRAMEKAGTDLVLRRGRIANRHETSDFPMIDLPIESDGSDSAERARIAKLI
ncbi:hypothetical protein IT407_03220 [Candidatus Uhrbacteria bacterium]|nr:hypothetical protein [Candidatus Uhrbacteria bacterium]